MELNVGDVVILKSGSVPMTVIRVEEDNVACQWYNEMEGTFPTMDFVPEALQAMDDDEDFYAEEDEEEFETEDDL